MQIKAPISMIHNAEIWYLYGYKIEPVFSSPPINNYFCPYIYKIGIWVKDKTLVDSFDYEEVMAIEPWNFGENVFVVGGNKYA